LLAFILVAATYFTLLGELLWRGSLLLLSMPPLLACVSVCVVMFCVVLAAMLPCQLVASCPGSQQALGYARY